MTYATYSEGGEPGIALQGGTLAAALLYLRSTYPEKQFYKRFDEGRLRVRIGTVWMEVRAVEQAYSVN